MRVRNANSHIFWSSWHLELVVTKCQQDPPSYPLFIPSKPGQIRLLIKKSLWILPACHVMVYSKDILLQIWISWLSYLFLSPLLIHVAFSHLLVLGCWELERLIEQYSLIHWSAIHLEIFLKEIFETMAKFHKMILSKHSKWFFLLLCWWIYQNGGQTNSETMMIKQE